MPFRTRTQSSTGNGNHNINANFDHEGPVGAPKVSHVKEVLATLRTRLESRLEESDGHDIAMVRALKSNIHRQLEQIKEALAQIEQGKYGVCTNCITPIEADRLVVRPYATLCLNCQSTQDRNTQVRS